MQGLALQASLASKGRLPLLALVGAFPSRTVTSRSPISPSLRRREFPWLNLRGSVIRAEASNVGVGAGGYEGREEKEDQMSLYSHPTSDNSSERKPLRQIPYPVTIALVLVGCALVFSLIAFVKGGPSAILAAISKSGLAAAFSLIFVSEIGDKTFFIAALLAMQYEKGLVLLGSMGALSLMTILSVVIGRIFHSVPAQFQTTLPIGEYAAVTLLLFFGLKSIKDAWDLPSNEVNKNSPGLDEYAEAEELVKEKVSKPLSNPLEIIWKSFSLVFFAEWGDRSMLATIALGAAQVNFFGHIVFLSFPLLCNISKTYCIFPLISLVSMGCGKWSYCWTLHCNIHRGSWWSNSRQLHF
ncbi:GDT1-like protein 2 chloroplastic isoform X1 [Tripterygium wilfordii]|uniref:GDT1 family protein n=1 Tax=Tripterygium wilfordii TaxID=458696 RepID=A0A7J7CRD2_TRIWF|nr:GDT1-like protein 2 chloroplastic isoform X1 [Tripterygium wilfordii]